MEKAAADKSDGTNKVRNYIALALVVLAAALFVIWLASGDDDSDGGSSGRAEIVSADELNEAADDRAE
jgi:hypothetical protein